jgi:hypothetical protein
VLSAPERNSLLAAQGVSVDGEAELQDLRATGGDLEFRAAAIGSFVDAAGAQLHSPGGYTLNLVQANVKGSVRLVDGFESTGEVVLNRAGPRGGPCAPGPVRRACTPAGSGSPSGTAAYSSSGNKPPADPARGTRCRSRYAAGRRGRSGTSASSAAVQLSQ